MVAITVDHKVRKESTQEAQHVGNLLKERGIDHRIVTCEWPRGLPTAQPQVIIFILCYFRAEVME